MVSTYSALLHLQVKTELEEHGSGDDKGTYQQVEACWALGDCSANMEAPLPALAQVCLGSDASGLWHG